MGGETVNIGRCVRLEICGSGFAGTSCDGRESACDVGGVEEGGGELVVLEAEDESATVFVGDRGCVLEGIFLAFDELFG